MPAARTTHRPLVIASIMAAMFMVAIEATIVSTAMPLIVGQLGGLELYSWVFSSFLLTQTATTVVFGKLSDVYGRKPILIVGIAVFLGGSILCGFAWSMPSMIVFRLIQGVGAGAVQPIALTLVGDLYPAHERGKVQGWLASVWGVSSVVGPLVGGLIVQHVSWAWVFWINIPIGIVAAIGFLTFLHEGEMRERRPIDVIGAALFTATVAALMVALTALGTAGWREAAPSLAICAIAAILFVLQERRTPEPMIALKLWARRPIAASNAATLLAGMSLIGLTTFVPIYVQGVLGRSPLVAGFALTMMTLGWPIGATIASRTFMRFGIRTTLRAGSVFIPLGALAFVLLAPGSSPFLAGAGSLVMGLGMGLMTTSAIVLIQEIVARDERGAATASNIFSRNLGSTLGAAVLGAVVNHGLDIYGRDRGVSVTADTLRRTLEVPDASHPAVLASAAVRDVLQASLHMTFWSVLAISCAITLLSLWVPAVAIRRAHEVPAE